MATPLDDGIRLRVCSGARREDGEYIGWLRHRPGRTLRRGRTGKRESAEQNGHSAERTGKIYRELMVRHFNFLLIFLLTRAGYPRVVREG